MEKNKKEKKMEFILMVILFLCIILVVLLINKIEKKSVSNDLNLDKIEQEIENNPEKQMEFYKSIRKKDMKRLNNFLNK